MVPLFVPRIRKKKLKVGNTIVSNIVLKDFNRILLNDFEIANIFLVCLIDQSADTCLLDLNP